MRQITRASFKLIPRINTKIIFNQHFMRNIDQMTTNKRSKHKLNSVLIDNISYIWFS